MRESIFLCIPSIFNSRVLVGEVGQPAEFLSLVGAEVSWSVMFTLSLQKMLWSDCVDVMLSMPIIRIWVMASIHLRGLSFMWLRLERHWSHCESEVP